MTDAISLDGQLLIAMPDMSDPRFARSLILLCSHDSEGAMGLTVNKPLPALGFEELAGQMNLCEGAPARDLAVHRGGPVETARGFVLMAGPGAAEMDDALTFGAGFALSASRDALEALAQGGGPAQALLALGYAGWAPGQLEAEIAANGWLTCPATPELVFGAQGDDAWRAALAAIGVSPSLLGSGGQS